MNLTCVSIYWHQWSTLNALHKQYGTIFYIYQSLFDSSLDAPKMHRSKTLSPLLFILWPHAAVGPNYCKNKYLHKDRRFLSLRLATRLLFGIIAAWKCEGDKWKRKRNVPWFDFTPLYFELALENYFLRIFCVTFVLIKLKFFYFIK